MHMNSVVTLIHFTDTHLGDGPEFRLWGELTESPCAAAISDARRRFPKIDLVLHTGDATHDCGQPAKERLDRMLAQLAAPVAYTPGNHDLPEVMSGDPVRVDLPGWRVLLLNTRKPGAVEGRLDDETLAWLEQALRDATTPVLIGMHHPPLATATEWLDRIGLENAAALWAVIRRHARVHAILHGHTHMERTLLHEGVLVLGTPSTNGQFKPMTECFALDSQPPGYRWLRLHQDGKLESGVIRVAPKGNSW